MNPKSTITFAAALAAGLGCVSPALAQISIAEAPALYRGPATCATKFPGSFLDLGSAACWQCPATHPKRTIFIPITVPNACERPAQTLYRKASGPENPTGLVGTQCRSGWFPHWDLKCYSCGSGYVRTAEPNIAHARACVRVIPAAWTTATRKGVEGCPAGSFRNGVTPYCYQCPPDYSRNAVIADDLTKVNACTKVSASTHDRTRAWFEQHKGDRPEARASLGRSANAFKANAVSDDGTLLPNADSARRSEMRGLIDDEYEKNGDFKTVSWLISAGGSFILGYSHAEGFAMTRVESGRVCRKAWSNAFTAGISAGAGGGVEQMEFSKDPLKEGASQSNGWQIGASFPPVAAAFGLHGDATTGSMIMSLVFGPGVDIGLNLSEYVHTWAEIGKEVDCNKLTWGDGWKDL